jgi:V/A-type H+-transporting ATPase subunit K
MKWVLAASVVIVILTIGTGILICLTQGVADKGGVKGALFTNILAFFPFFVAAVIILIPDAVSAVGEEGITPSGLGFIAAALSTGLATLGAGYAVGAVGSSALGAVSEEPGILGKTLIFVGLAEGIAIYGLIISILILGRM